MMHSDLYMVQYVNKPGKKIIIIIITVIYKIDIVLYINCKETALRHFTNITKYKIFLHEHSIHMRIHTHKLKTI